MAWLSIHSAVLVAHRFPAACNKTIASIETAKFLVLNGNSVVIGLLGILILTFALFFYFKSLLNASYKYVCDSVKNLTNEERQKSQNDFYKGLIVEVLGTYFAFYCLELLNSSIDKRSYVDEELSNA